MTLSALKPCTFSGCRKLTREGRCDEHRRLDTGRWSDRNRPSDTARGYGWTWRQTSKRIQRRDGYLCQACRRAGRISSSYSTDHKVPKAEGGTDEDENLEAICRLCHQVKTQAEARRGAARRAGRSDVG